MIFSLYDTSNRLNSEQVEEGLNKLDTILSEITAESVVNLFLKHNKNISLVAEELLGDLKYRYDVRVDKRGIPFRYIVQEKIKHIISSDDGVSIIKKNQ